VENEERLSDLLGKKVMGGNARVGVELVAPGKIVHVSTGTIDFGEMEGKSQRAERIAEVFRRAQILGEFTADMKTLRWQKLMWNAAFNTVTALTRRRVGEVLDDTDSRALVFRLMQEVRVVARAEGADITQDRIDALILHSERNLRALKTSTLQDLERGRRLEYDALTGAVVRAARRHRIDVPATETVYALMKLLDGRDAAP
jgi:2-dehydropantoate 2-reductase